MSLGVARDTHEPAIEGVGAFVSLGGKRAFGRAPSLFFFSFRLSSLFVCLIKFKFFLFFSCVFCIFSVFFTGISFMFSFYFYIVFTIFVVQVLASKSFPFISCLRLSLDIFTCFQIFSSFFLPLYLLKLISSFFFVFLFGLYYFCFVLLYVPLISCYALLLFFLYVIFHFKVLTGKCEVIMTN